MFARLMYRTQHASARAVHMYMHVEQEQNIHVNERAVVLRTPPSPSCRVPTVNSAWCQCHDGRVERVHSPAIVQQRAWH